MGVRWDAGFIYIYIEINPVHTAPLYARQECMRGAELNEVRDLLVAVCLLTPLPHDDDHQAHTHTYCEFSLVLFKKHWECCAAATPLSLLTLMMIALNLPTHLFTSLHFQLLPSITTNTRNRNQLRNMFTFKEYLETRLL